MKHVGVSTVVTDPDPYGRAIRDHYLGERDEPLIDRDGNDTREHAIQDWYFEPFGGDSFLESWLDGPLIELGAGAGRLSLYFQEDVDCVALEVSEHLVQTMSDRGVADPRRGDMFALREQFERDRFRSALAIGSQLNLAGSMAGLRRFLADLAYITRPNATAVLDGYDPTQQRTLDVFGYRADPAPGLAYRIMHCEYAGMVGRTLVFRLFSPARLHAATIGTPWRVAVVRPFPAEDPVQFRAALEKA